jgi:hypothetical protein
MPELTWQKSTYSEQGSACVEIATTPTAVHIRDSKDLSGPRLALRPTTWADFLQDTRCERSRRRGGGCAATCGACCICGQAASRISPSPKGT